MSATQFDLTFEPSGTNFVDSPDGSLYAVHASPPAVNDGLAIAFKDLPNSSVSVALRAAQHGTLSGRPASLLLFEFKFSHSGQKYRIKYAAIDIEFKYSQTPRPPHIQSFCPSYVVGEEAKRTITTKGNAGFSMGHGQASLGLSMSASRTESLERPSRFTLTSVNTKTHSGGRIVNGARWVLTENENSQGGIPYFVPIVLLVQRNAPHNFIAKINIETKLSPGLNLKSWFGMRTGAPAFPIDVEEVIGRQLEEVGERFDDVDLETLVTLPSFV